MLNDLIRARRAAPLALLLFLPACSAGTVLDHELAPTATCQAQTTLSTADSEAFFPYHPGDRWVFRGTITSGAPPQTMYVSDLSVTGAETVDGVLTQVLADDNAQDAEDTQKRRLQVDDSGVWNRGPSELDGPFHEVTFPIKLCSTVVQFHVEPTDTGVDEDGDGTNEQRRATAMVTRRGREPVSTQLGTFPNSLRLEHSFATTTMLSKTSTLERTAAQSTEWYAPGLGLVKRVVAVGRQTFDEELMGATVNGAARGVFPLQYPLAAGLSPTSFEQPRPLRPVVASDGHHFLMVASEGNKSMVDLVGTLVSMDGILEQTFPVVEGVPSETQLDIAFDGESYLVVFQGKGGPVQGVRVSPGGAALGQRFTISADVTSETPAVAFGGGTYLVVYSRVENGDRNVYAARVSGAGDVSGEILVSGALDEQASPSVAFDGAHFLVVWQDMRGASSGGDTDIYAARVTPGGDVLDPLGSAISTAHGPETEPHVAFDGAQFVAVWYASKDPAVLGVGDIRGARIDVSGALLDGQTSSGGIVINANKTNLKGHPRVIRFGDGSLVVWEVLAPQPRSGRGIFGARLGVDGTLLDGPPTGDGLWVSGARRDGSTSTLLFPAITAGGDKYMLTWVDEAMGELRTSFVFPW